MEGVFEDEELSVEDALIYTEALLQAENAHKAPQGLLIDEVSASSDQASRPSQQQRFSDIAVPTDGQREIPLRV